MMQLWQASNQMVSWLKPDSEETQCSPYDDDDDELADVEEFSGVGTLVVITVLGCLFIWFSFMPRRHCRQNSHLQHTLETQREQHPQQQQQQQQEQQQLHLPQPTHPILHVDLKQDKVTVNAIDASPDNWQDVLPNEDDEIQKLCLNLNAIHRLSTKANINLPCTSASLHFKPLKLVGKQRGKHPEKDSKSQLPGKMIEADRYHDLSVQDHEAECYEDLPSDESEEERFVDTLDT